MLVGGSKKQDEPPDIHVAKQPEGDGHKAPLSKAGLPLQLYATGVTCEQRLPKRWKNHILQNLKACCILATFENGTTVGSGYPPIDGVVSRIQSIQSTKILPNMKSGVAENRDKEGAWWNSCKL